MFTYVKVCVCIPQKKGSLTFPPSKIAIVVWTSSERAHNFLEPAHLVERGTLCEEQYFNEDARALNLE